MNKQETIDALDELAQRKAYLAEVAQRASAAVDRLVPDDIKAQQEETQAQYDALALPVAEAIDALTKAITAAVKEQGESVKATSLIAVYSKGRVTWDTRALDGYAKAHPEVDTFRKQGEPTVVIRSS